MLAHLIIFIGTFFDESKKVGKKILGYGLYFQI